MEMMSGGLVWGVFTSYKDSSGGACVSWDLFWFLVLKSRGHLWESSASLSSGRRTLGSMTRVQISFTLIINVKKPSILCDCKAGQQIFSKNVLLGEIMDIFDNDQNGYF